MSTENMETVQETRTHIFLRGWNSSGELVSFFSDKPLQVAVRGKLQFLAWRSNVI